MIVHKLTIPFGDIINWNVQFLFNTLTIDVPVADAILNVKVSLLEEIISKQPVTYSLNSTTFHFNPKSKSLQIFLPDDIAFHWIDFIEIDYHSVTEDRDLKLGKLLID